MNKIIVNNNIINSNFDLKINNNKLKTIVQINPLPVTKMARRVLPVRLYQNERLKTIPFPILANKTTGIINNPSRKSEPRIKPKKSEKREITKNNNIETIKKYFNVSAFAFKKSSFLKAARKNGSAAKRNICTNNNKMPPSLRAAP